MMGYSIRDRWGIVLSSLMLFIVSISLSSNALWMGDDITYRYHFETGDEISTISDAFTSQIEHYKVVNGRFLAHFLVQICIALLGQHFFALINPIFLIVLLILIVKLSGVSIRNNLKIVIIFILILFGFQTKYVPSCQIGYIWMFVLVLTYIYVFLQKHELSRWNCLWLIPLSFCAGFSQEAIVIGVSSSLIVYTIANLKQMTLIQWVMLFSFGFGAMCLCLSPATLSRTAEIHGSFDFLPPFMYSLIKLLYYSRVIYILLIYVLCLIIIRKVSLKEIIINNYFYWISIFVLLLFNIVIGVFGNRQLFGIELMSIILFIKLLNQYTASKKFLYILCGIGIIWVSFFWYGGMKFLSHMYYIKNELVESYCTSEDGIVYYDFASADVTFYETYPSDVFTPYVLSTIGRYEKDKRSLIYDLRILPTCCTRKTNFEKNSWINPKKGTYNVLINRDSGLNHFVQKRNVIVLGCSIPIRDRLINEVATYGDDSIMVYTIYDKFPGVVTQGFQFLE